MRVERGEIADQQDIVAVDRNRLAAARFDNHRPVMARLFLQPRVAVIPICPRLADGECIIESLTGLDAGEADTRNAIILERQQQPVPVHRAVYRKVVGDVEADILSFGQPDQRPRHTAVDCDPGAALALHDAVAAADRQIDHRPAHLVEPGWNQWTPAAVPAAMHIVPLRPSRHRQHGCTKTEAAQNRSSGKLVVHSRCISFYQQIVYPPMVLQAQRTA